MGVSLGVNDATIPTSDVTTNDAATTKHGWLPKLGGGTTNFLRADGTWSAPAGGGLPNAVTLSTDYSQATSFTDTLTGGGVNTYAAGGVNMNTSTTTTSGIRTVWPIMGGTMDAFAASPVAGFRMRINSASLGTDVDWYCGLGGPAATGGTLAFTNNHTGWKLQNISSTTTVKATQGDGTTESASASQTTLAANDRFDLIIAPSGTTSVNYYYRKNEGALSSAINLANNLPGAGNVQTPIINMSNRGTTAQTQVTVHAGSYVR